MMRNSPSSSVCHILPYLSAAYGGPVLAAAGMAQCLLAGGCQVRVAGLLTADERPAAAFDGVAVDTFTDSRWGALRYSPTLWRYLKTVKADVFHSHGLWTDVHRAAAAAARVRGIPHVIGPCGMLMPLAMRRSQWKKWPVWHGFQKRALRTAACIVCNSEMERRGIVRLGLGRPLAVVPNPILGPDRLDSESADSTLNAWPKLNGRRLLLYLGRLHPVKGLTRLIDAWAGLPPEIRDGWQLVLAGPDEGGFRAGLEWQIAQTGCANSTTFTGPLGNSSKWPLLKAADLFVMPSDFENFGIAIAEAMLAATPVITTTGSPWECLAREAAGWWVPPTVDSLRGAMAEAMQAAPDTLTEMGERARCLAVRFSVETVSESLLQLYRWLLGQGEMPECVHIA